MAPRRISILRALVESLVDLRERRKLILAAQSELKHAN